MTGLTRALRVDISGFENHVAGIVSRETRSGKSASDLWADVRANAYGHGVEVIEPALRRHGILNFIDDSVLITNEMAPHVLDADETYGVAKGGPGFTTFVGEVVNVKHVRAGRRVSYGYTYHTSRDTTLALIALGYADGVARRASNICDVAVSGPHGETIGRIAGRIAMDQFVVDLDGEHEVAVGSEVVLWSSSAGSSRSVAEWSVATGISPLALISHVGDRVAREVLL